MKETKTFYQNPKLDFLFGLVNSEPIPTKQDKFAPVSVVQVDDVGNNTVLQNFYVKKPDQDAIINFNHLIQEVAKDVFVNDLIIRKPLNIEVILSISVTERRFKEVDVDNLAKAVLDGLNGIAYEDDSQITSLICSKQIHPLKKNGILIGITKLTEARQGFGSEIKLYGDAAWV